MSATMGCPTCGKQLKLREELLGKKLRCPCGTILATTRPASVLPAAAEEATGCDYWKVALPDAATLLLIFDADGMWLAKPGDKKASKRLQEALATTATPGEVVPEETTFVPYERVSEAYCNLKQPGIGIVYNLGQGMLSEAFAIEDAQEREEKMQELGRRLGSGFSYRKERLHPLRAAAEPLVWAAIVAVVAGILLLIAWDWNRPTNHERSVMASGWAIAAAYTVGFIGPVGTGLLGGLAVAGTLGWAAYRAVTSPIEITIKAIQDKTPPRASKKRKARREASDD